MIIDIALGEEALYSTLSYLKNECFLYDNKLKDNLDIKNIHFNKNGEYYNPNFIGLGFKRSIDNIIYGINSGGKRGPKNKFKNPEINNHFNVNVIEEDEEENENNSFNFLYESKLSLYLRNLIKISDIKLNDFSFHQHGEEFKNSEIVDSIEDSVRFYLERNDFINTFNFHYSINSGFSYFIEIFKDYIKDESPKSNLIFLPIQYNNNFSENIFNMDPSLIEQRYSYNLINEIYHYGRLLDEVDCMIPIYQSFNSNNTYNDLNYFIDTDLTNFESINSDFYYQNFYFDNFLSNIANPCYKTNHIKSLLNELKVFPNMNLFSCLSLYNTSKEKFILENLNKKIKLSNFYKKDSLSIDSNDEDIRYYNIFYNDDSLNLDNSSIYKSLYITNSSYDYMSNNYLKNKINIQNKQKNYKFINSIDYKNNEVFINEEFLFSNDCIVMPKLNKLLQKKINKFDMKQLNIIKEFNLEDDYIEYMEAINKNLESYEELYDHLRNNN